MQIDDAQAMSLTAIASPGPQDVPVMTSQQPSSLFLNFVNIVDDEMRVSFRCL
jgi:hypothetical protein